MESEKGFNGVDIWFKALKMDALLSHRDQGKFERSFQVEDMARTKGQGENRASKISQTQQQRPILTRAVDFNLGATASYRAIDVLQGKYGIFS